MEDSHFNCRIRMYIHPEGGKKGLADAKDIILSLLDYYDLGYFSGYMISHEPVQRSKKKGFIGSYPIEIGSNTTYENILKFRDELKENERITLKGFDFIKEPPKLKVSRPEKPPEPEKPTSDIGAISPPKPVTKVPKEPGYDISFKGYEASHSYFGRNCRLECIGEGDLHWEMNLSGQDVSVLPFYVEDARRIKPKSLRFHYLGDGVSHTFDLLSEETPDMDRAVKASRKLKGRILRGRMKSYTENLMRNKPKK